MVFIKSKNLHCVRPQKEPLEVENMAKLRQGGMDGAWWLKSNSN